MSSPQVITTEKIERDTEIAVQSATDEKGANALADATAKDNAVINAHDGDIDMSNAVAQAGRQLSRSVIEQRLKQLNRNLRFEPSKARPDICGIYLGDYFLCGMEWDRSPEFTVNFVGEDGNGKKELLRQVRGWRTVLDLLIRKGFIEAESAKKLFEVGKGRESANWNSLHN